MSQVVTLHVQIDGKDSNPGSTAQPLKSIEGARDAARKYLGKTVVVEFGSGVYRLSKSVVFSERDSGRVTYRPEKGAEVRFAGSVAFRPQWKPFKGKVLQCAVPEGFDTDQIFIDGQKQVLARYPNENPAIPILNGYSKDAISRDRVARWIDPRGGYLHVMHASMWGDFHYRILGKDGNGGLRMEGGWQNNRLSGMHPEYRFVEGVFEELDAPGEWFLDHTKHVLYYYPRPGVDLQNGLVEGPQLRSLVEFRGAKGITLSGFTFRHTLRTFMDNREPLLRSDWTTYRGGALYFKGAKDCQIENSVLEDLGGNAIFVDGKNRNLSFKACRIENVGANGVAFVGDPKAVRSPLFEYNQRQSYEKMDNAPGPKSDEYPARCLVEDCLITRIGRTEKQSAGVQIAMSRDITVSHCSIYHVPRAGINIGDGCWGGHVIEGCDVFDTVLETGDHGSFNSWGRDRYWNLTDIDMTKGERPELATLDSVQPTIIRNNRWRCDHGWDIDLDDGSSRYIIENNLCLNGGIKNREGFERVVENNVMVGNSFHPHVWFLNSGDVFAHNIVFTPYRPIGVKRPWGKEVDDNFLYVPGASSAVNAEILSKESGRDLHSLMGDAKFVDPAKGDFRVREGSPALSLGFRNFAMDSFGVRPGALRALAATPQIGNEPEHSPVAERGTWLGAKVKDLLDPGEISATGLTESAGVLVFEVPAGSVASKLGLRALDVLQSVDGKQVSSVRELVKLGGFKVLSVWRDQGRVELRN